MVERRAVVAALAGSVVAAVLLVSAFPAVATSPPGTLKPGGGAPPAATSGGMGTTPSGSGGAAAAVAPKPQSVGGLLLLLGIGFIAGVIAAVSPCVLPVLPIVLAGGAAGGRRRPYAIIAGLVASFTVFTLSASALLSALGLPQDTLRDLAIALLFIVAATLFVPRLGEVIEAPLSRLSRRPSGDLGGGFLLGASLGLVFVPCAGPVLATVTVLAAQHRFSGTLVLLTLCYAVGSGVVLLLIAVGGQRVSVRLRATRAWWRPALGAVMVGAAIAIVFNLDQTLQTRLGSYTNALQRHTEESGTAGSHLSDLRGKSAGSLNLTAAPVPTPAGRLPNYGAAPNFAGIVDWLNTPGERPLTIAGLRGKVVLVDFWTYSCINCLRTLPHLRAWYAAYHRDGFEIVGVHSPEFAFEHVLGNVRAAVGRLHVTWPVALDNNFVTWTAYANEYWPADYLIDQRGNVRDVGFGEGRYTETEAAIRKLLGVTGPKTDVSNLTPTDRLTPETYLGPSRLDLTRYVGSRPVAGRQSSYRPARVVPEDAISLGGRWTLAGQTATAGAGARLLLHYHARDVFFVLGGHGRVTVTLDGRPLQPIDVNADRLYTVLSGKTIGDAILEFAFTRGVRAYSFTFG
ncbi:MAG TPA: cytochrome c biogenesis protein CcdA [Gaiellaceae bacterium]|nr:cytochrome c biogenesis protein CcdA [Gaiellaceae bacterium]